ncbi:hypothetical protein [Gluconobacter oxydans]|uniref:hypothetical protein n=1 Tax=Gluconobacter oxydans TaxID=442 RepID=UPI0039E8A7D3
MTYRLGKRAPKHDPRTYRLGRVLAVRLPDVPAERNWSQNVPYQMWGNDRYGCCAFAAHAALVATWTKAAQGLVILSTDQVLANYAAVTGFDPATGTNDDGTVLLDELNAWRQTGFQRPGQTLDYLTAFGCVNRLFVLCDGTGLRRHTQSCLLHDEVSRAQGVFPGCIGVGRDIAAEVDVPGTDSRNILHRGNGPVGRRCPVPKRNRF